MTRLDDEIRSAVGELVAAAPPPPDPDDLTGVATEPTPERRFAPAFAAAVLGAVVMVGAAVFLFLDRGDDGSADPNPSELPVPTLDTAIDVAVGEAFGLQPGLAVGPDDALAAVTPVLGPLDVDTGWIPLTTEIRPCQELTEYRELWWGDLAFGFWGRGSATYLHFWHVGDRRVVLFVLPDVDVPASGEATGLTTEIGVAIGDPADEVTGVEDRGFRPEVLEGVDGSLLNTPVIDGSEEVLGSYLAVDGLVAAFGAESFDCGR